MKPILLIIDGMDRSGKTSLINYINIDRGPIGYKAYSHLHKKDNIPCDYNKLESELSNINHLCIYLYASERVITNRFKKTKEKPLKQSIKEHLDAFFTFYTTSILNKVRFDTGKYSTKQIYEKIIKQIAK